MARVENGNIKGILGNVIFYSMNGKTYARLKPQKSKKKKNKDQSTQVNRFSLVSKYGSPILNQLKPELRYKFNLDTYNHFRGWLTTEFNRRGNNEIWKNSIADTSLHNLNKAFDLRDVLLIMPKLLISKNAKISIDFPSFIPLYKIKAAPKTVEVKIKLLAIASPFSGDANLATLVTKEFRVPFNKEVTPERKFSFKIKGNKNDILFIALALECITDKLSSSNEIIDLDYLPAAFIALGKI
jgi:hypothetical protein